MSINEQARRIITRRKTFVLLGLATASAALSCAVPESNPTTEERFTLESNQAKNYKKKLYFYNDYPNSTLNISTKFIEELFSSPDGVQIPDGSAIAVLFSKKHPTVQVTNSYLLEFTQLWREHLAKDHGTIPAKTSVIVLYPEQYITYDKNGIVDFVTHKNLSLAFVRNVKREADKLMNRPQEGELQDSLKNKTSNQEPVRIQLR